MKKSTFLALVVLLCGGFSLSAQSSNHPFPTENAYWHTALDCGQYGMDLFSCGDTVFDGIKYQQLYITLSHPGFEKKGYTGGYRVTGEQVFFRPYFFLQGERLIYDFSMQVGDSSQLFRCLFDTSTSSLTLYGAPFFVVEKIDSIQFPDGWRKRWQVRNDVFSYEVETWIEGIGATLSPLHRFRCFPTNNLWATMQCFWKNGEVEYTADTTVQCDLVFPPECLVTVSTSQPAKEKLAVSVFPNPFSEQLTISFSDGLSPSVSVSLFDLFGREIKIQYQTSGDAFQIQSGNFPAGLYFLKIENSARSGVSQVFKVVAN